MWDMYGKKDLILKIIYTFQINLNTLHLGQNIFEGNLLYVISIDTSDDRSMTRDTLKCP